MLIAIDGPSGSGKSSTSRGVAQRLGLAYLDTGSMYRAAAWAWRDSGIDPDDADAVQRFVETLHLEVGTDAARPTIGVNGTDVTEAIRDPEISTVVSRVATNLGVRKALTDQMRALIDQYGRRMVVEGRDITTVVAPDADVRVLIVADPAVRIARRQAELAGVPTEQVTDQIVRRDRDDATVSQFEQPAEGVTLIDSTHDDLATVIQRVVDLVPAAR